MKTRQLIARVGQYIGLALLSIWFAKAWEWEPLIGMVGAAFALVVQDLRLLRGRPRSPDAEVIEDLKKLLPDSGAISFLRRKQSLEQPFEQRYVADLERFIAEWPYEVQRFRDLQLENQRRELHVAVSGVLTWISVHTGRGPVRSVSATVSDRERRQLVQLVDAVVTTHHALVSRATDVGIAPVGSLGEG